MGNRFPVWTYLVSIRCLGGLSLTPRSCSFIQSPYIKSRDLCAYKCAFFSASTESLEGMLVGRFFVGIGMGIGPSVTALYVTEVLDIYFEFFVFALVFSYRYMKVLPYWDTCLSSYLETHIFTLQVSPAYVRGTYGSSTQIATCLGLLGSLFAGIPAKDNLGW